MKIYETREWVGILSEIKEAWVTVVSSYDQKNFERASDRLLHSTLKTQFNYLLQKEGLPLLEIVSDVLDTFFPNEMNIVNALDKLLAEFSNHEASDLDLLDSWFKKFVRPNNSSSLIQISETEDQLLTILVKRIRNQYLFTNKILLPESKILPKKAGHLKFKMKRILKEVYKYYGLKYDASKAMYFFDDSIYQVFKKYGYFKGKNSDNSSTKLISKFELTLVKWAYLSVNRYPNFNDFCFFINYLCGFLAIYTVIGLLPYTRTPHGQIFFPISILEEPVSPLIISLSKAVAFLAGSTAWLKCIFETERKRRLYNQFTGSLQDVLYNIRDGNFQMIENRLFNRIRNIIIKTSNKYNME